MNLHGKIGVPSCYFAMKAVLLSTATHMKPSHARTHVAAGRMAHPPQSHPQPRRDGGWGEKGGRGHAKEVTKAVFHGFCACMAMCFCGMRGGGMPAIE